MSLPMPSGAMPVVMNFKDLADVGSSVGSAARGAVLYRGASTWDALAVGTDGQQLETRGAGANPAWDTEATAAGTQRIISSGSSTLTTGAVTDVSTFSRNASERVGMQTFMTDDTLNNLFAECDGSLSANSFRGYFRRTATANQGKLTLQNPSLGTLSCDWLVLGIVP